MSRVTRRDLEGLIGRIARLEGRPKTVWDSASGEYLSNIGAIELGHDAYGWHVGEVNNQYGGTRNMCNGTANEVYQWLSGYCECLWQQATKEGTK
jgi:hypothetical protein